MHAKPVIFDSGDLATAMHSSMAIPSVFSPVQTDSNTLLVDGGVYRNFPVQEAIDLGADYIIGVYVGFPDKVSVDDLNGLPSILARTTLLSGTKDVASQTELVDLLIEPDLGEYGTSSFSKGKEIQELGEQAAESIFPALRKLADSINSMGPAPGKISLPENDSVWITDIRIENLKEARQNFVYRKTGLRPGMWVSPDILEEAINLASGTLYFEKITYRFERHSDGIHLVLNVRERPDTYVKAGVHYDNYYGAGIILGLSKQNFLFHGTKLNLIGDISKYPQFRANMNKYIGPRQNLYASLIFHADISKLPVFEEELRVGYAADNFLKAGFSVNYIMKTNNRVGLAAHYRISNLKPDDVIKKLYPIFTFDKIGFHAADVGIQYEHNSLNSNLYPVNGTHAFMDVNYILTGEEYITHGSIDSTEIGDVRFDVTPFWKISAGFENYFPLAERFSLNSGLSIGLSSEQTLLTDVYFIGGHRYNLRRNQVPFVGLSPDQLGVFNFVKLNLGLQYEPVDGLFTGLSLNYLFTSEVPGELFDQAFSPDGENQNFGLGGGITYKSPLGPLTIWFGSQTYEFTPTWYINFGFTF